MTENEIVLVAQGLREARKMAEGDSEVDTVDMVIECVAHNLQGGVHGFDKAQFFEQSEYGFIA